MTAIRNWPHRRFITLVVLALLATLSLTAKDTWSTSTSVAQAGYCVVTDAHWQLQSDAVAVKYGRAHFGATVCMENGKITSARPFLEGGVEGAGSTVGFTWESQGAWTQSQTNTRVEFRGQAKAKLCVAGKYTPVCSLTETQNYVGTFSSTLGPYRPSQTPGIKATATWCSGTGCHTEVLRQRV